MESVKAFILTGESFDLKGKNTLRFYGTSNEAGPVEIIINNYKPVIFVENNSLPSDFNFQYKLKPLSFKTFDGKEVSAVYFNTQRELKLATEKLSSYGIKTYEADIDPVKRFLMEKGINAQAEISGEFKKEGNLITFFNPKVEPAEISPQFIIASLDIETGTDGSIYSIALHITGKTGEIKRVFITGSEKKNTVDFISFFDNEKEMIEEFISWFKKIDPDIIIGWNIVGFDLLFLEERCSFYNINFNLSRGNTKHILKRKISGGYFIKIPGRIVIDGPQTLRMSFYSFEDYKLETIAKEMLGIGKKIDIDKNRVDEIERLYKEDKIALAEYNLQDTILVTEIFQKSRLIQLLQKRSQLSGLLMDQLGMMTAAFDHFFLPKLHKAGYVAPNVKDIKATEHAAGGYVMDPKPGIYEHVAVLDFKSLYPSIIRTFKIDPLSRLKRDKNPVYTPVKFYFSSTEHILPEFIGWLMEQRAFAASKKDKALSQAIKILMNSFYGVMGSYGCRFYHPDLPSAITETGQWILLRSKEYLESLGYKVLYGDTDSLFIKLKETEDIDFENAGRNLAKNLTIFWNKKIHNEFNIESYLEIKFEKYYRKFIITLARSGVEAGAKKRYAGLVSKKGKEEIEFVGMEFVRSDWTKLSKEFQVELYKKIFNGEDVNSWIKEVVADIQNGKFDDKLVYRKRLRKDIDEYIKNIPPQVKAAKMIESSGKNIIYYVITKKGPVPLDLNPRDIDYQHYIDKQIKPIADSVLGLFGESFNSIINPVQLNIFD